MMTSKTIELTLSIVLAVATVAYTIINLMMWFESRATRRQKMAPLMIAYLESTANKQVLCLFIKNVGEGCAKNVKAKLLRDHDCLGKDDWPLSKFPLFNEGVNVFPSGYQLHTISIIGTPSEQTEWKIILNLKLLVGMSMVETDKLIPMY